MTTRYLYGKISILLDSILKVVVPLGGIVFMKKPFSKSYRFFYITCFNEISADAAETIATQDVNDRPADEHTLLFNAKNSIKKCKLR